MIKCQQSRSEGVEWCLLVCLCGAGDYERSGNCRLKMKTWFQMYREGARSRFRGFVLECRTECRIVGKEGAIA